MKGTNASCAFETKKITLHRCNFCFNLKTNDKRYFQKSCIDFTIGARPLERYMPKDRNSFKYKVWRIVVSTPFEYFIMMLIVFNTLLLMMKVRSESLRFLIILIVLFSVFPMKISNRQGIHSLFVEQLMTPLSSIIQKNVV